MARIILSKICKFSDKICYNDGENEFCGRLRQPEVPKVEFGLVDFGCVMNVNSGGYGYQSEI